LVNRRADSDYHPARFGLALIMSTSMTEPRIGSAVRTEESAVSAVSWAAIFAGAFTTTAITVVLTMLGTGFGLAWVSPWPGLGSSATIFTISAGIGLIVVQWVASGMGGFIAGRLRTKWVGLHTHEVFFRDTAHGFVTWAIASVFGAMVLASATSSVVGAGQVAGPAFQAASTNILTSSAGTYGMDLLFRSDRQDTNVPDQDVRPEAARILVNGLQNGEIPDSDRGYLVQLVAMKTGISQEQAKKRVDVAIENARLAVEKAKHVADSVRRAAANFSIFGALSMLIGAFIASVSAAYGGSLRDEY